MNLNEIDSYITARYVSFLSDEERIRHLNEVYLDLSRIFTVDSIEELSGEGIDTKPNDNSFVMPIVARAIDSVFVKEEKDGYVIGDAELLARLVVAADISLLDIPGLMGIEVDDIMDKYDLNKDSTLDVNDKVKVEQKIENNSFHKRLKKVNKNAIIFPQQRGAGYSDGSFFKRIGTDDIFLKVKRWAVNRSVGNRFELIFDPIPRGTIPLLIRYEPMPAGLEADSDVPQYIPEEYHYLIAWGSLALIASLPGQEDWEVAQVWESRYRDGVNNMISALGMNAPDNYPATADRVKDIRRAQRNV